MELTAFYVERTLCFTKEFSKNKNVRNAIVELQRGLKGVINQTLGLAIERNSELECLKHFSEGDQRKELHERPDLAEGPISFGLATSSTTPMPIQTKLARMSSLDEMLLEMRRDNAARDKREAARDEEILALNRKMLARDKREAARDKREAAQDKREAARDRKMHQLRQEVHELRTIVYPIHLRALLDVCRGIFMKEMGESGKWEHYRDKHDPTQLIADIASRVDLSSEVVEFVCNSSTERTNGNRAAHDCTMEQARAVIPTVQDEESRKKFKAMFKFIFLERF